jgi:pimeloyl-ACP methyl ester carboxylesterase
MRHPTPTPPELGVHDGLSYALFLPEDEPVAGVVVLHGAGSAKESHFDFARGCRDDGIAALAYDARGHGDSGGSFGPGAIDDALAMVELLRAHAPRVALRGSSMGGFQAIHAGARNPAVCAVVAICPAPEDGLLRFLRSGRALEFECDVEACKPWLESLDLSQATASLGPETALLLLHARGDEQVPYAVSEHLYEVASEPRRLLLMPGGHHRSVQHDLELQAVSRKFIRDAAQRSPQHPAT